MTNVVDFARVRNGREKLALLAQKYPELRGTSSAENVASWIETLQSNGEENVVEYEKKCKYILCGKTFMAGRKDKDYCVNAHRTAANKLRDNEPSDLAKLMTRAVEFDAQFYGHPSNPDVKRARDAALRDVHSAIETELGIVHEQARETHEPKVHDEPSTVETERVSSTPELVREKLKDFMAKHNVTQGRIAELCGSNQSQISRFLNGKDQSQEFRNAIEKMIDERR